MINKIFLTLLSTFVLTNCSDIKTNPNTVTKSDDFDIIINHPDTIDHEQEFFASLHIANTKYKLIHASFDCNVTDTSTVDTVRVNRSYHRIFGCNKNLTIENDSVKIYLTTGPEPGKINFDEITLLAIGLDNKYYYQKCTFDFYVK